MTESGVSTTNVPGRPCLSANGMRSEVQNILNALKRNLKNCACGRQQVFNWPGCNLNIGPDVSVNIKKMQLSL